MHSVLRSRRRRERQPCSSGHSSVPTIGLQTGSDHPTVREIVAHSRSYCLSPARTRAVDTAVTSSSYARLFPDLPAFTADEAFLYALGRAGGLCDCGDAEDDEASLGTEAAG